MHDQISSYYFRMSWCWWINCSFHFTDLPSSIIGILLLALLLRIGWIKLEWVNEVAGFLVSTLPFYFVPAGVAVMLYFDLIAASFTAIVVASAVSTVLVLIVTGWTHQLIRNKSRKTRDNILVPTTYERDISKWSGRSSSYIILLAGAAGFRQKQVSFAQSHSYHHLIYRSFVSDDFQYQLWSVPKRW